MERTLVLLKPDTVQRGLIGTIITRIENKGLTVSGIKMIQLTDEILREHYAHIADKPFFPGVAKFMKSNPVVALCITGEDAVTQVRNMVGATNCKVAEQGTIRAQFGNSMGMNLIHASDPAEDPEAEVIRFFGEAEVFAYEKVLNQYIYQS